MVGMMTMMMRKINMKKKISLKEKLRRYDQSVGNTQYLLDGNGGTFKMKKVSKRGYKIL